MRKYMDYIAISKPQGKSFVVNSGELSFADEIKTFSARRRINEKISNLKAVHEIR